MQIEPSWSDPPDYEDPIPGRTGRELEKKDDSKRPQLIRTRNAPAKAHQRGTPGAVPGGRYQPDPKESPRFGAPRWNGMSAAPPEPSRAVGTNPTEESPRFGAPRWNGMSAAPPEPSRVAASMYFTGKSARSSPRRGSGPGKRSTPSWSTRIGKSVASSSKTSKQGNREPATASGSWKGMPSVSRRSSARALISRTSAICGRYS